MIQNVICALYSPELLFLVVLLSFVIKIYLIKPLAISGFQRFTLKHPCFFLIATLIGTFFGDIAWIIKLAREIRLIHISYGSLIFCIRISWGFLLVQYQALSLFLESLIAKKFRLNIRHKINLFCSTIMAVYFFYLAFYESNLNSLISRSTALRQSPWTPEIPLEVKMMNANIYFSLFFLMLPSIVITLKNYNKITLPTILRHQLAILLKYLIGSYLMVELLQATTFLFLSYEAYIYPVVSISTLILSYAIYYSINSVLGIRFLNTHTHVQSTLNVNIIHDFKNALEQLSVATSTQEVAQITQVFFRDSFSIPFGKAQLYIRAQENENGSNQHSEETIQSAVQEFIQSNCPTICEYIMKEKILIHDELDFSNFYHASERRTTLLQFLERIDADIFLPIYQKEALIAYIIVNHHPKKQKLYGNIERDEMIIFAGYLSNIINVIQHKNLPSLMLHEKNIKDELALCRQEIKHYKESIRHFISRQSKITGIIFYKQRKFTYGNQTARDLIGINLNLQDGHFLTEEFRQLVLRVNEYKITQTVIVTNEKGDKLVLSAIPNIEYNNVIILVHYPEINDLLNTKINNLHNPTQWDYLLYLETTKAGQLANQFIPGSGELLLNTKISFLQSCLNRKPLLLNIPADDLIAAVELLHHLSEGDLLHIIQCDRLSNSAEFEAKLFGTHPHTSGTPQELPLFKKLGKKGTILFNQAHLLPLDIQERLAEYIKYGYYSALFNDRHMKSNVRLLFATNEPLTPLLQERSFSKELYKELKQSMLQIPNLATFSESELFELIDGFCEQAIKGADFKKILTLNEHEKKKIIQSAPQSFHALRIRVEQALVKKSKRNNMYQETYFDPAYHISDPELSAAARLGKHALRDEKIMMLLWNKFQNQNKIAAFLGVNRSSVNRRCKQYSLE